MSLKLSEIKNLHEKGLSLLYLHSKEKRPIGNDWQRLPNKTWDELENSFEKTHNLGVRLGEPSKLLSGNYLGAIDCDVKSGSRKAIKEMNEALRKLGIDLTTAPIVMSGRGNGSKHIYVQTKEPMRAMKFAQSEHRCKVLMPGENKQGKPHSKREMKELTEAERNEGYRIRATWEISFMGTTQQTVLPPSIHPDTGFKYAWASPLTVKHCPLFTPSKFVKQDQAKHLEGGDIDGLSFKAEKVDLWSSKLSVKYIKAIESGDGCEDRSATLFAATMAMCRAGMTDNQILSVLSNPDNWIAEAAYEHTQSKDRLRAVKWLYKYTLLKARYETDIMRKFDNKPELEPLSKKKAKEVREEIEDDKSHVLPDLDGKGTPRPTLRNVVHVLEAFMGGALIGFNEFSGRPFFLHDTEYGGKKSAELTDKDDLALKHHIATHYRFEPSKELCFEAHTLIAHKHKFHPVKDYLDSLKWDGVPRLDTWLINAFTAQGPEEYLKAVGRKVLTAAVSRIYEPGCKFDYMLVLEGDQGEGKSMSLGILAGRQWFTDSLGDIHNKDVVDQMTGKWLIEISELASIRGKESEHVKSFLSRQVDRVRMSYGRRSEDYPRQSIFIGSTNPSDYLTDETGNRRYWPVQIGKTNKKWVAENRDQLWAEAMLRYELGEDLYLPKPLEAIARKEQEKRFEVDEWECEIKKVLHNAEEDECFTSTQLWRAIHVNDGFGHPPLGDARRVGKIMRRMRYVPSVRRVEGVNTRCWARNHMVKS